MIASESSLSTTNSFTLTVKPVNQAPHFTLSTNVLVVLEETAGVTNAGFLTGFSVGPANESGQTWTFKATTATNSAANANFTTLPSVATNGTLTFSRRRIPYGTNTVTVVMTDSGGTTNGGVNAYTNTFTIAVQQTDHAPVIVWATNRTILENGATV